MTESCGLNRQALTPDEIKCSDSFLLPMEGRVYNEQYSNMYILKIKALREKAYQQGKKSWEGMKMDGTPAKYSAKVLDIGKQQLSWSVGTVYCDMELKPSILEEVSKSHFGAPPVAPEKYTEKDENEMYLEDESGRVKLVGEALKKTSLVTGCVIAVLGSELAGGEFEIIDIRFPEFAPQKSLKITDTTPKKYIAFISGLSITPNDQANIKYQLLKDFLKGEIGDESTQEVSSKILELVIAGNLVGKTDDSDSNDIANVVSFKTSTNDVKYRSSFESIQHLDQFLSDLEGTIPVTIMPGKDDLTNVTLPQQPIHKALLRQSKGSMLFNSFKTVSNPQNMSINDIEILVDAGQTINDMFKYFKQDDIDRISLMNQCLRWQTLAPTAPDTLYSYPYMVKDPFLLTSTPHLYVSGNQPYYDTRLVESVDENDDPVTVRLVTVPSFKETGQIVVVEITDPTFPTFSIKIGI